MSANGMPTTTGPGWARCDAGCGKRTTHRASSDSRVPACRGKCEAAVNAAAAECLLEQSTPTQEANAPKGNTHHES